jgi:hypothetical protein
MVIAFFTPYGLLYADVLDTSTGETFNGEKLLPILQKALTEFALKFPGKKGLWCFDHRRVLFLLFCST